MNIYTNIELYSQLGVFSIAFLLPIIFFSIYYIFSLIPLVLMTEKYILKWKFRILTIFSCLLPFLFALSFIPMIGLLFLLIAFILTLLITFGYFLSQIKIIVKTTGILRKSAISTLIGFLMQLIGIIFIIKPYGHIIAIIGANFIYIGMKKSKI